MKNILADVIETTARHRERFAYLPVLRTTAEAAAAVSAIPRIKCFGGPWPKDRTFPWLSQEPKPHEKDDVAAQIAAIVRVVEQNEVHF